MLSRSLAAVCFGRIFFRGFYPLLLAMLLLMSACSHMPENLKVDENGNYVGILLAYEERESSENDTIFQTEIRILPHRMLISDSRSNSGYLLVDREKKIIYNINRDDKTIMEIKQQPIAAQSPVSIEYKMSSQPSGAIPKIATVKAMHYRIDVNGKHCYDTVSAGADFLPEITQALKEFRLILASEHAKSVARIPKDMVDSCDLAINVFHSADHLANGFPLREWDRHGYLRFVRYWKTDAKINPESLALPQGYESYSVH